MKKCIVLSLLVCLLLCGCGQAASEQPNVTALTTGQTEQTVPTGSGCTVTFQDYDGTVLASLIVESGQAAAAPADPVREDHIFVGWDRELSCVTEDMTVTARYIAATGPTVLTGSISGAAGESVQVSVRIYKNPGIAGAKLTFVYDPALILTSGESGPAFSVLDYTGPGKFVSPCNFTWDSESGEATQNGDILYLTFMIPANGISDQTYAVNCIYNEGDIYDEALNDVTIEVISGVITVE